MESIYAVGKNRICSCKRVSEREIIWFVLPIKRGTVSIPANIAEGTGRQYKRDTIQFLHIARGFIYELETLLKVAADVNILSAERLK